jgi:NDP-sugar pyrophosphorylase family protein
MNINLDWYKAEIINRVNTVLYVLGSKVFDFLEKNSYCDMPTLFNSLQSDKVRAILYPIYEVWNDIRWLDKYNNVSGFEK